MLYEQEAGGRFIRVGITALFDNTVIFMYLFANEHLLNERG